MALLKVVQSFLLKNKILKYTNEMQLNHQLYAISPALYHQYHLCFNCF